MDIKYLRKRHKELDIYTPLIAGCGVIQHPDDDNTILMIERGVPPYGIAFPGGMMEIGETITECALREVKEETDLDCDPKGILAIHSDPENDPRWHVVIHYILMKAKTDKATALDDAKAVFWVNLDEIFESQNMMDRILESSHDTIDQYISYLNGNGGLLHMY